MKRHTSSMDPAEKGGCSESGQQTQASASASCRLPFVELSDDSSTHEPNAADGADCDLTTRHNNVSSAFKSNGSRMRRDIIVISAE